MANWDDSEPIRVEHVEERAGAGGGAPIQRIAWTQEQLVRLEHEWRRLQRAFAYHPHVRVVPLKGDPPDQYQVEFRLRSLAWGEGGQLEYATTASLHIWLPPNFPHEPPLVRPMTRIFHPNVGEDGAVINQFWTGPACTLAQLVSGLGAMLAYQTYDYDPNAVVNQTAMDWISANPDHLPVDGEANLAPEAGGEPLSRICHFGPRTLEQLRTQLKGMCDSLLAAEGAPTNRQVGEFCEKTRQQLDLFLDSEMPADLSGPASEVDEWAKLLPASFPLWEVLRQHRAVATASLQVGRMMKEAGRELEHEINLVSGLVSAQPAADAAQTMRLIPGVAKLELHQGGIASAITRAEHALAGARTCITRLQTLPKIASPTFAGLLQKRLEAEVERGTAIGPQSLEKVQAEYQALDVILGHGRIHAAALKRLTGWREYVDLLDRAAELCKSITDLEAEGVQAYYIENSSGRFGPFELEQKVEIGPVNLAVRGPSAGVIELVNADTCRALTRAEGGAVAVNVPDPKSGEKYPTTFRLTPTCEELALQLDYLAREATRTLDSLHSKLRSPDSWLGRFNDALGSRASQEAIRSHHNELLRHWNALLADLRSLRPFKERMATHRMVARTIDAVLHLVEKLKTANKAMESATERVAAIMSVCARDTESGQLLVPQKFAKEYPEQLRKRDEAMAHVKSVTKQFHVASEDVLFRTSNPDLLGMADWPALTVLHMPESWAETAGELADEALAERIGQLESPLNVRLQPEIWPSGAAPMPAAEPVLGLGGLASDRELAEAAELAQLVQGAEDGIPPIANPDDDAAEQS